MPPSTPDPAPPPDSSEDPPDPPELRSKPRLWSGLDPLGLDQLVLDRLGLTQTIGGLVLGLIALFSSYDHITFAGRIIPLQHQWGIPLIVASEQIKKETEQLRRENARLKMLNAKTKTLVSYVDQHCFPPESSSTPIPPIEPGSSSS